MKHLLPVFVSLAVSMSVAASSVTEKIVAMPMAKVRSLAAEVAEETAKDTPKQLNRRTWMIGATFVKSTDTFIYYYQAEGTADRAWLRPRLVNGVCSNEILRAFLEKNITFQYYYSAPDGNHIFSENVTVSDCL